MAVVADMIRHGQLQTFNKTILRIEKTRASACDIVNEIKVLQNNLKERFENKFIPLEAKKILAKLFEDGIIDEIAVKKEFTGFYERCLSYIDLWKDSFADAEKFMWIQNSAITFPELEEAAERINRKIGRTAINTDELFDEVVLVKAYLSTNSETWKSDDMSCEEKWVLMMKHFGEKGISVANFSLVLEYIFSLPGTSAAVERVFSMMNNIWSPERGSLLVSTVKSLLFCKLNIDLNCSQFYEKIKNDQLFLKKVHSSEKYDWFKSKEKK